MNQMQRYIFNDDKKWFLKLKPFLSGKILKVGNGLGYLSSLIENKSKKFEVIDIVANKLAINKEKVKTYNGLDFPFKDKTFDCVVCVFVLHHTQNPSRILDEMKRVGKRIIILEETYDNFISKLDLIYRDLYVNGIASQTYKIYWNNYSSKQGIRTKFKNKGLKITHHYEERKRRYWKELFVLEYQSK